MIEPRTFTLDGRLQVVFAILCGGIIESLSDQKEDHEDFFIPGASHPVRYVDDEESDKRIKLLEDFRRQVWDGGAADLLSRGML
jgi:hypothetical protein